MSTDLTFFEAIKKNQPETVRALLNQDASLLHLHTENGDSPVILAVYHGAREALNVLLSHSLDSELSWFEAAAVGNPYRLAALIDTDPEIIYTYSHDGWTALHLTSFFGHTDATRILLAAGAPLDVRSLNPMQNHPIHAAIAGYYQKELVELLIEHGADLDAKESGGYTPLHEAALRGYAELVTTLLANDADATLTNEDGKTALELAAEKGHKVVCEILLPYSNARFIQ
ncbi:ankyrin repeat domain-containing protein [Brevibacillus dissolubilis]|uniref:ankyrin repeat domain-containing protein n=1 Tax=Brevibacillus dissolubilis TaxID=1844116 RepID=UPI001115D3B9|nr:ankyrin repeat domain-containing protein [Brevibacillus dissolubilis]